MNSRGLVVIGSARSQEIALRPGANSSFDHGGFSERISSLRPRIVKVLAAVGAAVALGFAGLQLLSSDQIPWLWSALGGTCAFVGLTGFVSSKCVRCGASHYVVSDLFTSETIPFNDVCLVVEAPGFLWQLVRIHLRRPSRFGWAVSYVPARSATKSCSVFVSWRTCESTKSRTELD
jgi:hypothetical protein